MSKSTQTFVIYFFIASNQIVLLFPLFSSYAWVTLLGTSRPYLRVTFFIRYFTLVITLYFFLKLNGAYHTNSGSSINSLASTYSAVLIPCDSFIYRSGTHEFFPSFHCTSRYHNLMVCLRDLFPFLDTVNSFLFGNALPSDLLLFMWSISWYWWQYLSTWEYMFSAIVFASYWWTAPSGNITSHTLVFRIGLWLNSLIICPSLFLLTPTTLAAFWWSPSLGSTTSDFM